MPIIENEIKEEKYAEELFSAREECLSLFSVYMKNAQRTESMQEVNTVVN